jgi:hypothetical protein
MIDMQTIALAFLTTMFAAWAGLVLGVSFLSARAKFRAPSITIRVAMEIGRQTFQTLSRTEIALGVTASLACAISLTLPVAAGLALVWSLIATERFWLLPVLDLRAGIRMTGRVPGPSYHHALFARLEMVKAALLLLCSGVSLIHVAAK